jgi:hypothetical protein
MLIRKLAAASAAPVAGTLAAVVVALVSPAARAEEGMWTPDNLPLAHLQQTYGFTPDPAWIAKVMHASVRVEDGCSGSFISPDGLVMTNHHCVEECVGQLSTAGHDLMRDGFLARARNEERRCPDFALDRLERITDVTARVAAAARGRSGAAYADARRAEIARIEGECTKDPAAGAHCEVVDLYHGAVQHLYRYHRFDDVRLVFVPEYDIAQFGGDPDNFNFPRYDLDIGLVRAYENGRPVHPADFLRFDRAGAKAGELTITSGHPGTTRRQFTVAQLERVRDVDGPWRLTRLAEQRGMVTRFMQESPENARIAKNELDDIENSYKAWYGELLALRDPQVFALKRREEAALREFAAQRPELKDDLPAWDEIARAQATWRDIVLRYRFTEGGQGAWSRYFEIARMLVRAADERTKPDGERLPDYKTSRLGGTEQDVMSTAPIYPAFEQVKLAWSLTKLREWLGADDPLVRQVLDRAAPEALAARWTAQTRLGDVAERERLWRGGRAAVDASDDPFIRLARILDPESRALRKRVEAEVEAVEQQNAERIARVRFAQTGTGAYPDATFTLRFSFGQVEGWDEHGRTVPPFTILEGLYERATDFDPFRLPPSWLDTKGRIDPKQPMNFVTTNDIVGGNSGSPVIDRAGDIVGLVFDGNIESLGGAFWWDERSNRCVAVHSGFILEALEKVYRADALVAEIAKKP